VKVLQYSFHSVPPKYKVLAIHTTQHTELRVFKKSSINYIINVNFLDMEEKLGDSETWIDQNDSNHNLQVESSFHSN